MRINFDETDYKLFNILVREEYHDKFFSSTQLAKMIFNINNVYELRKYDIIIRNRIKKWAKFGIFEIKEVNGIKFVGVDLSKIKRKRFENKDYIFLDLGKIKLLYESSNSNVRIRNKFINK